MKTATLFFFFLFTAFSGYTQTSMGAFGGISGRPWKKDDVSGLGPQFGIDVKYRNQSKFRPGFSLFLTEIPCPQKFNVQGQTAEISIQFESILGHLYCDVLFTNNDKFNFGANAGIGLAWLKNPSVSLVNGSSSVTGFNDFDQLFDNQKWTTFLATAVFIDHRIKPRFWLQYKLGAQQFISPNRLKGQLTFYTPGGGKQTQEVNQSLNSFKLFFHVGTYFDLVARNQ